MVLFHDIVEVFGVADDDRRLVSLVVLPDRCRVRATLIDGELLRELLGTNRLAQKGLRSGLIASGRQQKINGLPISVDRTI